mmetsp:Transcript_140601/g.437281  ORF Transcript_140601/g.437281 Transcript_140601/m.437281 type:complete len:209 (+) Transcript_140601:251-877(+)
MFSSLGCAGSSAAAVSFGVSPFLEQLRVVQHLSTVKLLAASLVKRTGHFRMRSCCPPSSSALVWDTCRLAILVEPMDDAWCEARACERLPDAPASLPARSIKAAAGGVWPPTVACELAAPCSCAPPSPSSMKEAVPAACGRALVPISPSCKGGRSLTVWGASRPNSSMEAVVCRRAPLPTGSRFSTRAKASPRWTSGTPNVPPQGPWP